MTYLLLFIEFFKIGLFSVGGLASLPFLFDLVGKYDWFTSAELTNMIAVSQSAPGPIAINLATYAGYQAAGFGGSVIATVALILPPVLISLLICKIIVGWRQNKYVNMAFSSLRPATAGLIAAIGISLFSLAVFGSMDFGIANLLAGSSVTETIFSVKALIFFIILTPFVFRFQKSPLIFIALGALIGIVFQF